MAAESESEEETEPAPREYDREAEFDGIQQQATAFESELNAFVDPWIAFSEKLLRSRTFLGWAFFGLSLIVGVFIYTGTDWKPWYAFIGVLLPVGFALWTGYVQKEARTSGRGIPRSEGKPKSEGLPHDRAQLSMVLTEACRSLEGARDLGRKGMGHRTDSVLADLAALCTVRMKALLFHQKKQSREGKLNDICGKMIKAARITSLAAPLGLMILVTATLAPPFIFWNVSTPWMNAEFALMLAALMLAGFFASLVPVFMVLRFVRRVQGELLETLQSREIEPHAFDSTDSITEEFQRILKERHDYQQAIRNRRSTELSLPPGGRTPALPVPALSEAGEEPSSG